MKKPEGMAEPNWYDSPENPGMEQYWNGKYWTKQTRPIGNTSEFKEKNNLSLSISNGFTKIFDYRGTAKRFEYWYFFFFSYLSIFIVGAISGAISAFQGLSGIYSLCLIPCLLSCEVRRMHDVGKSGWFILVPIYSLYLLVQPSVVQEREI
jgi:hypothetical protein